jgi:hypothetical protein
MVRMPVIKIGAAAGRRAPRHGGLLCPALGLACYTVALQIRCAHPASNPDFAAPNAQAVKRAGNVDRIIKPSAMRPK